MEYIHFDHSRAYDLVPLGRICIDFNPVDINQSLVYSNHFNKYVGGSPANIAVGMARLGKKVGFIGKISDDRFGEYVVQYFRAEGIDTSHITRCKNGEKLGLAFTEILSPTQSSLLMYRDGVADLQLEPEDIDEEYIKNTKILLISGTALCKSPSREAALKAIHLAKKYHTVVVFDIDYRAYSWKSKDEISIYYSLVGKESDIIIGSKEEFDLMERLMINGTSSDAQTARRWHSFGCKIVIIKHGKEGSTAYTNDGESYVIKPFSIQLLKSFGGGDGYGSAFLYALLEGWPMMDALEFGTASAAMLVSAPSCSAAMPTVQQIQEFIAESKTKNGEVVTKE